MIRVWRIPFSTNVERVALALAHKGLEVDWVDVDPADRGPVVVVSGQPLVPVLEEQGRVVADSTAILNYLDEHHPEPALYPRDEARRAEARMLVDWFNRVWKGPPNELDGLLDTAERDETRVQTLAAELEGSRELFESLLADRDYLLGDEPGVLDFAVFPFLKYGLFGMPPDDDEQLHRILSDHLRLEGGYPRLAAWISRVDELPRA
jgi:glutathione S-transferase